MQYDDNKEALKQILRKNNIRTPKTFSLEEVENGKIYFVKPLSLGDSIGIDESSICTTKAQVFEKLQELKEKYHSKNNLIEEYIEGKDVSVSILKTDEKTYAYGIEIIAENTILDFQTKIKNSEKYRPCTDKNSIETALKVFEIIGATSYARIDFRIDNQGNAYVLEINLCAGLGKNDGYLYKCFALNSDISYKNMIELILKIKNE